MYINVIFSIYVFMILYVEHGFSQFPCFYPGVVALSSGAINGTSVNITAYYEFLNMDFNVISLHYGIFANPLWVIPLPASVNLNQIIIYAIDTHGHYSSNCTHYECYVETKANNASVYILYDIDYEENNHLDDDDINIRSEKNEQKNALVPIIHIQYQNGVPAYNLTEITCALNNTTRYVVSRNFSQASAMLNVVDCYCCADPVTNWLNLCPNSKFVPGNVTLDPVASNGTTGTTTSSTTTIGTYSSTIISQSGTCPYEFENMDILGWDLGRVDGNDFSDCCTQCINFTECVAWTFLPGSCYLKSSAGPMTPRNGISGGIYKNITNPCLYPGVVALSTGTINDTRVNITAYYEFLNMEYNETSLQYNITANSLWFHQLPPSVHLNKIFIYAVDNHGQYNRTCPLNDSYECYVETKANNASVYILYDIDYEENNQIIYDGEINIKSEKNQQKNALVPIIHIQYKNGVPAYNFTDLTCVQNKTSRFVDNKNFSQISVMLHVVDCYCCTDPLIKWTNSCQNSIFVPTSVTLDPITLSTASSNITISNPSTITTTSRTTSSTRSNTTSTGSNKKLKFCQKFLSILEKMCVSLCEKMCTTISRTTSSTTTSMNSTSSSTTTRSTTTSHTSTSSGTSSTRSTTTTTESHMDCQDGTRFSAHLEVHNDSNAYVESIITTPYTTNNHSVTAHVVDSPKGLYVNDIFLEKIDSDGTNRTSCLNNLPNGYCSLHIKSHATVNFIFAIQLLNGNQINVTVESEDYQEYMPYMHNIPYNAPGCHNNRTILTLTDSQNERVNFYLYYCYCCISSTRTCEYLEDTGTTTSSRPTTTESPITVVGTTIKTTSVLTTSNTTHVNHTSHETKTTRSTTTPPTLTTTIAAYDGSTPNCTNPTDPFSQIFCNLNATAPPYEIANNVTRHMNPSNLTGYDIFVIAHIMKNLTSRRNLLHDDFHGISRMVDVLLGASHDSFVQSNDDRWEATYIILTCNHFLMLNAPKNATFLNGTHFGLANFDVDCSTSEDTQMGDNGNEFVTTDLDSNVDSIISIPKSTVCQNRVSRQFYYGIYRNTKLFVGNSTHPTNAHFNSKYMPNFGSENDYKNQKDHSNVHGKEIIWNFPSWGPTQHTNIFGHYISENTHFWTEAPKSKFLNTDSSSSNNDTPSTPSSCTNGFWYGDGKVLTGTLLDPNSTSPTKQYIEIDGVRQNMIIVKYLKKNIKRPLHGSLKLSWFDRENSIWSKQTCDFKDDGDYWVSECDHLTDFTLIVDGSQKDPSLCNTALTVIGYIINMGSIFSLITLNLIFILHRFSFSSKTSFFRFIYGRTTVDMFTLFYNTVLLIFYISFGIFSDEKHTSGSTGCKIVAGINYWLLLCCICMSIFQAWKILKVFAWTTAGEQLMAWLTNKVVIICVTLGFPSIMALILGLAFKNFYSREDEFCWIRPDYIVPGVIIPLTLLIANALFCLVIISFRLFPKLCGMRLMRMNSNTIGKRKAGQDRLLTLFFMQCTLGIPWILQYLTLFTPSITAWHYLFTLVNGSQGIILLAIYIYKRIQFYKLYHRDSTSSTSGDLDPNSKAKRSSTKSTYLNNRVFRNFSNGLPRQINVKNMKLPRFKYENM